MGAATVGAAVSAPTIEADSQAAENPAIEGPQVTDESLDSLRVLLTAMAREDRQDLLRQIEPR